MALLKKEEKPFAIQIVNRDITERKKAEIALKDANEKWTSLTGNSNDIIMIVDAKGVIRYINKPIPPYTQEQTIGTAAYNYVPKEQQGILQESIRKVVETGAPDSYETCSDVPNIGMLWFSTKVIPIKHEKDVVSIIMIATDITGRKRMEESLRESEQRLREAQTIGRMGNWEFDLDTQKIFWSDQVYDLYERDRALGPPTAEEESKYYSQEQNRVLKGYAAKATEAGESFKYDLQANLPDGRTTELSATMQPVKDQSGRVVKLIGTVQDITARKVAERLLKESEEKYRVLVEHAIDAIVVVQDGLLKFANPAALEITGYSREEMMSKPFLEFVHPMDREFLAANYAKRMRGEQFPEDINSGSLERMVPSSGSR